MGGRNLTMVTPSNTFQTHSDPGFEHSSSSKVQAHLPMYSGKQDTCSLGALGGNSATRTLISYSSSLSSLCLAALPLRPLTSEVASFEIPEVCPSTNLRIRPGMVAVGHPVPSMVTEGWRAPSLPLSGNSHTWQGRQSSREGGG